MPSLDDGGDEPSLEELLRDLGPNEGWMVDGLGDEGHGDKKGDRNIGEEEEEEVKKLLEEGRALLASPESPSDGLSSSASRAYIRTATSGRGSDETRGQPDDADHGDANKTGDDEVAEEAIDDREAEAYLQRVLDEIALEDADPHGQSQDHQQNPSGRSSSQSPHPPSPTSPSRPSTHSAPNPSPPSPPSAPLNLPSVPTTLPTRKPPSTSPSPSTSKPEKFSAEEIDSWCTICLEDAALVCPGCENARYCMRCWTEGHRGEGAGWEERMHQSKRL
ncbi:MAG: hypothetical protein M1817_005109 [Caeruleum heppii]|nr:MAG: hypothetical protein M1817_005109 [Caeruleum heppii]